MVAMVVQTWSSSIGEVDPGHQFKAILGHIVPSRPVWVMRDLAQKTKTKAKSHWRFICAVVWGTGSPTGHNQGNRY